MSVLKKTAKFFKTIKKIKILIKFFFDIDRVLEFGVPVANAVKELHSLISKQLMEHVNAQREDDMVHIANMLFLLPQLR